MSASSEILQENLKILMKQRKINTFNLSMEIDLSRPTLTKLIKNQNTNIKFSTLEKLADFFGVELHLLLKKDAFLEVAKNTLLEENE